MPVFCTSVTFGWSLMIIDDSMLKLGYMSVIFIDPRVKIDKI